MRSWTWWGSACCLLLAYCLAGVLLSVAIDQALFAPVFIAAFMAVLTAIEVTHERRDPAALLCSCCVRVLCLYENAMLHQQGKPQNVIPKLKQDLPDAVKVNWALWVPAQVGVARLLWPAPHT